MEMSPQRVRDVEFKSARKGVDPDEVREFLNDVADELERAQNQSAAMEARARAAVARLQEVSERRDAAPPPGASADDTIVTSVDESETISRTLLLAQRTADTTVAEARGEAAQVVRAANDEAAKTLDSTREMAAQLVVEARNEARVAGESERVTVAGEVESLKARRDFLESDVEQLEIFMTDQRNRIRESATSLLDITDRVPGGLGEARRPLLSASDDDSSDAAHGATRSTDDHEQPFTDAEEDGAEEDAAERDDPDRDDPELDGADDGDLLIVTELADDSADPPSVHDDPWSDERNDPTTAMAAVDTSTVESGAAQNDDGEEFRFSFDDDRR